MQEAKDQQTETSEEEEEEPSNEKKEPEQKEEEIEEENFYTIPLSKAWLRPPNKRAPKAIKIIREFVKRHMKIRHINSGEGDEEEKLVILNEVNEKIWSRGVENPPRKIRVRVTKDKEGKICVRLVEGD